MLSCLVLKDGSVARVICNTSSSGKILLFLICSREKHLHFHGKSQEKSVGNIRQDVYVSFTEGFAEHSRTVKTSI